MSPTPDTPTYHGLPVIASSFVTDDHLYVFYSASRLPRIRRKRFARIRAWFKRRAGQ